ncbi:hypothetical protein GCM10023075_67690 [Streptosporangium album]
MVIMIAKITGWLGRSRLVHHAIDTKMPGPFDITPPTTSFLVGQVKAQARARNGKEISDIREGVTLTSARNPGSMFADLKIHPPFAATGDSYADGTCLLPT